MTEDELADRIMARIERDQAIHKSSIVQEIELFQMAYLESCFARTASKKPYDVRSVQALIDKGLREVQAKRDGYPVEGSK